MRIKYALLVFVVFVILCGVLFTSFYEKARQESIRNLNTEQLLHARQAARGIEDFFANWTTILTTLSETSHIRDMDRTGRENMESLHKGNSGLVRAVTRVDAQGRIIYTSPYDPKAIGRDISSQKHIREIMETRRPVISDVFFTVQGYSAVALHVPVFKDGNYQGTIAAVVNFQSLAKRYLEVIKVGKTGYAWVISRDGIELFCPIPGHVGHSVFDNCRDFPSILAMAREMVKGHEGATVYTFDKIRGDKVDVVKKHAVYMPITIGNTFWSIVVASSEDEILSSLKGFRNRLILITGVLLLGGVLFFYYGLNAWSIVREEDKRRRAEEEVRKSERRYRTIVENTNDALYIHDFEGNILDVNENACRMIGYTRNELVGANLAKIDSPENAGLLPARMKKLLKDNNTVFEGTHVRKDGSLVPVEISAKVVTHKGKGVVQGFARDITDRKRMEEEIAGEKAKLKTLSDNAPFGMILIDKDGRFTYVNPKFTEIFGFGLSDVPDGRTWCRKAYPNADYRHAVLATWMEDVKGARPGSNKSRVFAATCKDGTQKVVNFITSVLASGEYLVACEDITELRHLESQLRQAQKMEAIGTLAGGIAHDFNNILTVIIGFAGLLKMDMDKADPKAGYLDQILGSTQKAANLTHSLLAFSRKQRITLKPCRINDIVIETADLLKRLLTEDIELIVERSPDNPIVMAEATQIDQILMNLATNARDAMPRGGNLRIRVATETIDDRFIIVHGYGNPGDYAVITVTDTGVGMNEETREHIFEPFFTTKEVGKGTGLGLSTVYGIVKQHDGHISVESEPGKGTIFRIWLPLIHAAVEERKTPTRAEAKRGTETILVAEDDPGVRALTVSLLREYGYTVIEAGDGEEALRLFSDNGKEITLVVCDVVMPKMNGRETCEAIKKIRPDIKVLFTSGYTRDVIIDKGIDETVDFIRKPIDPREFIARVREVLDREKREPSQD